MHAIIRRYEASDKIRTSEIVKKAQDSLLPRLSEMPGFAGYYLIEAGNGVFSSVGIFDSQVQAEEFNGVASASAQRCESPQAAGPLPKLHPSSRGQENVKRTASATPSTQSRPDSSPPRCSTTSPRT